MLEFVVAILPVGSCGPFQFFFFPLQKEHGIRFSQGGGGKTDGIGDFGLLAQLYSAPTCFHLQLDLHLRVHPPSCSGSCLPGRGHVSQLTSAPPVSFPNPNQCASLPHLTPSPGVPWGTRSVMLNTPLNAHATPVLRVPTWSQTPRNREPTTHLLNGGCGIPLLVSLLHRVRVRVAPRPTPLVKGAGLLIFLFFF